MWKTKKPSTISEPSMNVYIRVCVWVSMCLVCVWCALCVLCVLCVWCVLCVFCVCLVCLSACVRVLGVSVCRVCIRVRACTYVFMCSQRKKEGGCEEYTATNVFMSLEVLTICDVETIILRN